MERGTAAERIEDFVFSGYRRAVGTVALVSGSRAAAEDAVQEALVRCWERLDRGETIDSLPAWITRVALNLARSGVRRRLAEQRARRRLDPEDDTVATDPNTDHADVERALRALTPREREVTVLHYFEGLNIAATADVLSITGGSVKTLLHRARTKLAVALGERLDTAEPHEASRA